MLCAYRNPTPTFQILRISNLPSRFFERVIAPHQHLLFETQAHALLEIYTGDMMSALLTARIPCEQLSVAPGDDGGTANGRAIPHARAIPRSVTAPITASMGMEPNAIQPS